MSKKTVFFPNLDGLRFLAFLSVFFAHTFYSSLSHIQTNEFYTFSRFIGKHGALGVNFFFVLSGFLITYLLLEEKKVSDKIHVGNFYLRRILRIWPLYYAVVVIGYFLFPLAQSFFGEFQKEAGLVYYLLFISNYTPTPPQNAILGILWSIAVEEQFYLLWPVIMAVFPIRKLQYVFITIITLSFVLRTFVLSNVYENSLACMSDLAMGSWIAFLVFKNDKLKNKIDRLSKIKIILAYLAGLTLIFCKDLWNHIPFMHNNERLLFSIFFAFIILEQNYASNSFYKMGHFPLLSKLGKYTYGLYMLHFVAIYLIFKLLTLLGWNNNIFQVLVLEPILALSLSILISFLSFHVLESPFLKLKRRFAKIVKD